MSSLRPSLLSFVLILAAHPALAQDDSIPTVTGEGAASKYGVGNFAVTLPDGSSCTANFSGGKFSVFGHSATKTTTTCVKAGVPQAVRTVVYRRLNGTPREAILSFNDGTKLRVLIPRADDAKQP